MREKGYRELEMKKSNINQIELSKKYPKLSKKYANETSFPRIIQNSGSINLNVRSTRLLKNLNLKLNDIIEITIKVIKRH